MNIHVNHVMYAFLLYTDYMISIHESTFDDVTVQSMQLDFIVYTMFSSNA